MSQVPKTYQQFVHQCLTVSVISMTRRVYNSAEANKSSGHMKKREQIRRKSNTEFELFNDARTKDGYCYALAVHYGRKALRTPTIHGKKAYAWMTNRAAKRPGSKDGAAWQQAVASGAAVVTPYVAPAAPRPWRKDMLKKQRGVFSKMASRTLMDIFGGKR
jgi:hypothetical protein